MTIDEYFEGHTKSRRIYEAVARQLAEIGETKTKVGKSQVAFKRRRNVAIVWMPGKYLSGEVAPLVLTISLPKADSSPRWKEIDQIGPGRYTHHLDLLDVNEVDGQVKEWLKAAWELA